ncbi:MAG: type ISP restriction/modification enzyme [Cyanobacteria bacterium P01_D01_bin.6]
MVREFQAIVTGTPEQRVEALRSHLDYPSIQRDPGGSRFWYLRPGADEDEAEFTCPIAVGFYAELDDMEQREVPRFLTADEQQQEIYGHYTNRVIPDQPVMYLLLPEGERCGTVAMILPTETTLRQRQIQAFAWNAEDLQARLGRLRQDTLARTNRMRESALSVVPLVEWAFYKPITTARELAQQLAVVSRKIETAIPAVYDTEETDGYLHNLLRSFQRELLPTLKLQGSTAKDYSFADIYAQTIAYGLFTARVFSYTVDERERRETDDPTRKERDFNRQNAWELLPETNPFLRRLFRDVSQQPIAVLGDELGDAISEVFSILRAAKMEAILEDFRSKMNREDIVIRFYEDFLAAYKPEMRERRGVYYTPEPVVSYMVRSVDILLKEKFDKPLGLADPEVMILDPACGTGTFLLYIFREIHQRFEENPEALTEGLADKSWSGYVKERLLPRIFGFELLMAPYAIAHLKLGLFLEETKYQFDSGRRLGVFLTNTLDEAVHKSESLFEEFIAEESDQAADIKSQKPVMIVIGNPPYSATSANTGNWIVRLTKDSYYPKDDIKEQNPKLLLDDYVKFIRFSQWRIQETGFGIFAFINNHGYLNNSTFRRMRESLLDTFDEFSILDLHGNIKRKEKGDSKEQDGNVFDIQQGVAIGIGIRNKKEQSKEDNPCITRQHDLWGSRESKYIYLENSNIKEQDWEQIDPVKPFFLLIPQDTSNLLEYQKGWKITDAMPVNSTGVKTHRDHFAFDFDYQTLKSNIEAFRNLQIADDDFAKTYNLRNTRDWKIADRRLSLSRNQEWNNFFTQCVYRPFDWRAYYHHKDIVELPRSEVVKNILQEGAFGLCATRQVNGAFMHAMCTEHPVTDCTISSASKERTYLFPLFIYPETSDGERSILGDKRHPNFADSFWNEICQKLKFEPTPESIFFYIVAILHSPGYRNRYADFLKIDFPRIPLTSDSDFFHKLASYGKGIFKLYLLKSRSLEELITEFEGRGECVVAPGHPKYQNGKVIINKQGDGFTGVPEEVWNFYVGGYQVCHKWLKDRKGRTLSDDDILHYQRIVVALKETITLMQKIDEAIPEWPIQ